MDQTPAATSTSRPTPLDLFLSESPPAGSLTPITENLRWLRCGLPFRLNHINLWLLREGDGWVIVDTGLGNETTQKIWLNVFSKELAPARPQRVICTHFHPDHMGCAGWLVKHYDLPFYAPLTEWAFGQMMSLCPPERYAGIISRYYTRFGLSGDRLNSVMEYGNHYARNVTPLPDALLRLRDGDILAIGGSDWQVMTVGGHTPEHACLYNAAEKILIGGDQILPFISPNISVSFFEPEADPLSDYLASLERLRTLPADTLVLPSHGIPFRGLHTRIDMLKAHHAERLALIERSCATPQTAAALMDVLFPQMLDRHQIMFAIGEAAAHANHLVKRGVLVRVTGEVFSYVRS